MVSKVYMICNAYESGYGCGLDGKDSYCNPFKEGTEEHEAYSIGRKEGAKRRKENQEYCKAKDVNRKFQRNRMVKHLKTQNVYTIIGFGKLEKDKSEVAIYESFINGDIWVRSIQEFEDGRFELVDF